MASTLEAMNVSKYASEMSFILIQQPGIIIRVTVVALGCYVFPLFSKDNIGSFAVPYFALCQIMLLETILLCSLLTTRFSQGSILKST